MPAHLRKINFRRANANRAANTAATPANTAIPPLRKPRQPLRKSRISRVNSGVVSLTSLPSVSSVVKKQNCLW